LLIIGDVVSLRSQVAWLEEQPLFGQRVLVTRPAGQETELVRRLEELGAEVFVQPAVQITEPADWRPVDQALARLSEYQWLVFTSVNGVHSLVRRLRQLRRDLRALGPLRLAAIGPATAAALRGYHLEPDVVPESFRSEELARTLQPLVAGQRVLLARADRGRDILRESLSAVASVEQLAVYSQKDVAEADPEIRRLLAEGHIDYVLITSSNIARSLSRMLDAPGREALTGNRVQVISISPVTSEAVRELGWPVAAEATVYTTEGVIDALLQLRAGQELPPRIPCQSLPSILDALDG
jgi:uroporphyrinogen III methyltransferase/synthase